MAEGKKSKVTQTGSHIGRTDDQRATLIGLGLNKLPSHPRTRGQPRGARHDQQGAPSGAR